MAAAIAPGATSRTDSSRAVAMRNTKMNTIAFSGDGRDDHQHLEPSRASRRRWCPGSESTVVPINGEPGGGQQQQAAAAGFERVGPAVAWDRPGGVHRVLDGLGHA